MIEPPSKKLVERLTSLNLCRASDLRRCRRRVRQLARDLPAFDSVWIDALLQDRHLTPFQAKQLESSSPDQLTVGPCVLVNPLGSGPSATTYLAQHKTSGERCVLKVGHRSPNDSAVAQQQLQKTISRTDGHDSPFVVTPRSVVTDDDRLVIVSRHVDGTRLSDLLIRRGRFLPEIVREIGRQLITGLATLESRSTVHGDINLWNARLTMTGTAVLTDAGIAPAIHPEVMIRPDVPPDRYDGTAPERIATGFPATVASDMYALGCMLWQLLAGRPPFTTGDPLAKLAQHQTRPIANVREWAPDTPKDLVDFLNRMTAFSPKDRPDSFETLSREWGKVPTPQSPKLKAFAAGFRQAAPRLNLNRRTGSLLRRLGIALGASCGLLFAVALIDDGIRDYVEQQISAVSASVTALTDDTKLSDNETPVNTSTAAARQSGPLPLPQPDDDGVILLESKTYRWNRDLRVAKALTIRGAEGTSPVIVLTNSQRRITAPTVTLRNVTVTSANSNTAPSLVLQSRQVLLRDCRFATVSVPNKSTATMAAIQLIGGTIRSVRLRNVVFAAGGTAIRSDIPVASFLCENVLHLGQGALFDLQSPPTAGGTMQIDLNRTTQRGANALMAVSLPVSNQPLGKIAITARDCVFGITGRKAALFRLQGGFPGQLPSNLVQFSGEGSLIRPGTRIEHDGSDNPSAIEAEPVAVLIDGGLIAGPFEFAGPSSDKPTDSRIVRHRAPRRSQQPPGIDPATLKR